MINLEELKADREAGTDGPWTWKRLGDNVYGISPDVMNSLHDGTLQMIDTDARRIARLPELEAAYIEAVEVLRGLAYYNDKLADEYLKSTGTYSGFDEPGSVEAARKFLEKFYD